MASVIGFKKTSERAERLENPLGTDAWVAHETLVAGKVIAEFNLTADVEILDPDAGKIEPELRFGKETELGGLDAAFGGEHAVVAPEIKEALECEALEAEEIVHAPDT